MEPLKKHLSPVLMRLLREYERTEKEKVKELQESVIDENQSSRWNRSEVDRINSEFVAEQKKLFHGELSECSVLKEKIIDVIELEGHMTHAQAVAVWKHASCYDARNDDLSERIMEFMGFVNDLKGGGAK